MTHTRGETGDNGKRWRLKARRWAAQHFFAALAAYLEGDRATAAQEIEYAAAEAYVGLRRAP